MLFQFHSHSAMFRQKNCFLSYWYFSFSLLLQFATTVLRDISQLIITFHIALFLIKNIKSTECVREKERDMKNVDRCFLCFFLYNAKRHISDKKGRKKIFATRRRKKIFPYFLVHHTSSSAIAQPHDKFRKKWMCNILFARGIENCLLSSWILVAFYASACVPKQPKWEKVNSRKWINWYVRKWSERESERRKKILFSISIRYVCRFAYIQV